MEKFEFNPSKWAPFQDRDICEKIRNIKKEDFVKHHNPAIKINIVKDSEIAFLRIWDIFSRIKKSADENKRLVLILPQPHPQYKQVAFLCNKFRINCKNLFTFNMDEWADENGNIAPESYPNGFMYAMKHNFYHTLDKELRPPENQIQGLNNKNLKDYGKMIEDLGGADLCDGGIGWSGHVAFIDPGTKEFEGSLDEFKQMGPRIVTLSPFTISQSSLDPDFGMSGDWSAVPPRAATIGPAQVLGAKLRNSWNSFNIASTPVSWQRFTVRLAIHGPVTPEVPASILQIKPTNFYVSETIAQDIEFNPELSWYS